MLCSIYNLQGKTRVVNDIMVPIKIIMHFTFLQKT